MANGIYKITEDFEKALADYTGAPYVVLTDGCTHALELCFRYDNVKSTAFTPYTYLSVPMTFMKLGLYFFFQDTKWEDYYYIENTNVVDAAVYWKKDGYIPKTFMCLSFQHKKHLSLGRGGAILTDNEESAEILKKMVYDGRLRDTPWAEQNIDMLGYHYYMTPETAQLGLDKLDTAIATQPKQWTTKDWPDLTKMEIFKK